MVLILNSGNSFQIHYKSALGNDLSQLTNNENGNLIAIISTNGKFALVYEDNLGNEQGHWYRINTISKEKLCLTPEFQGYAAFCLATAQNNPERLAGWVLQDKENCILMIDQLSAARPQSEIIYRSKNTLSFPFMSATGDLISFVEIIGQEQYLIIYNPADRELKHINFPDKTPINPLFFINQEEILFLKSNDKNKRIFLFSLRTKAIKELPVNLEGDLDALDFNIDNSLMLFSSTSKAEVKLYLYDFSSNLFKKIGINKGSYDYFLNGGYVLEDQVLVRWQAGNQPPQIHSIDLRTRQSKEYLNFNNNIPILPEFISIKTDTPSGMVQAWLMLPKNNNKPVPLIVDLHGGPNSCALDEFSPEAQYYVNQGFGICYVNFHGSTTFGTKFENSIIGQPGWKEAQDALAIKNLLVKEGIADEQKCFLQGWSWGGFVSLLTAGISPSEFSAYVSVMGIGDLVSSYHDQHAYLQQMDDRLYGGNPDQVLEKYLVISPITYVDKISSPILIIHGKNDRHCPAKQMQNFVAKLKEYHKSHQVIWYDYGHLEMYSSSKVRENWQVPHILDR